MHNFLAGRPWRLRIEGKILNHVHYDITAWATTQFRFLFTYFFSVIKKKYATQTSRSLRFAALTPAEVFSPFYRSPPPSVLSVLSPRLLYRGLLRNIRKKSGLTSSKLLTLFFRKLTQEFLWNTGRRIHGV